MKWIFFTTFMFLLFLHSLCQECPSIYLRYSTEHSFCKPKNSSCPIFHSGVTSSDRQLIVNLHNEYRSVIALGSERRAGGLPEAADMLQMVWDNELEAVAQKRAEQCIYEHDCKDCRRVENFPVGQNIAYRQMTCYGNTICPTYSEPNWAAVIHSFYEEVAEFDKKYVNSMAFVPGRVFGHFTQMVWSKTWRIGCGFVVFKRGSGDRQLYVCNYGPSGNIMNTPMYKAGSRCSSCPINSCCGRSCNRTDYHGLCRMNRNNEAPIYEPEKTYIFYCDFRSLEGDCSNSVVGPGKWERVSTLGGSFAEIVLNGGETSTLKLKNTIKPKQNFCLIVKYRSGSAVNGQKTSNKVSIGFEMPKARPIFMSLPEVRNEHNYFTYSIDLGWSYDTVVSFTFSVPAGNPAQFLNIQLVSVQNGKCQKK